ncbi:PREDICTED: slit homolog 1 protein-like [Branchiostoma belcheri]|uniref:Slit homolog 1 protein-like n=1 Tax=Branchiostoma belcheri TaxID=7741 RepID=A0A6P4Y6V3_BRABE|nr:PREDICTED: slit homolog 1 protein-like [Branchiostoma belcheri]
MAVVRSLAEVFPVLLTAFIAVSAADPTCPSPCTCTDMYGELTVSCAGQGLTEIPPNIPTDVMWLNLKYNNITRITSNSFRGLQNLRGVDLAKNNINHISTSAFRDLQRLQTVDISVNQLSTLSEEVFNASITSARQEQRNFFVYMSDNPWNCDCGLKWLAEKLKTGSHHYSNRLITCNKPEYLSGKELENVPLDRLVCAPKLGADLNVNFMEVFNTVTPTPTSKPLLREPDKYRTDKMSFNIALGTAGAVIVIIVVGVKIHEFYKQKCSHRRQPVMEDLETLV